MTSVLGELPLSYAVLSAGRRCGSASAVHEPSPAGPPYRASSIALAELSPSAMPPRRSRESSTSRVRLHLKPGQKGTKQLLSQYGDRLICVRYRYDVQRKKRLKNGAPRRRTRLGTATASLRLRPDRRVTRRLCRRGSPRPGEAGRWDVESRPKGLAVALRPRGRAWPERPHRRRVRIQQWMPGVKRRESPSRISMQMPERHPGRDARIHRWMPASCRR